MRMPEANEVREAVRGKYGELATGGGSESCCSPGTSCSHDESAAAERSREIGYASAELAAVPAGANLGLGCGNPTAIAGLQPGETVLDLGSGSGLDCLLAAQRVGAAGRVIGVDMTPEMLARARDSARQAGRSNVEFRLGEIEHLPAADAEVDVVISNCVINLSPDKSTVFREAFRVLKPGGRLAVSDMVAMRPIPADIRNDLAQVASCVGGALTVPELTTALRESGFRNIRITTDPSSEQEIPAETGDRNTQARVASASIEADKPGPTSPVV